MIETAAVVEYWEQGWLLTPMQLAPTEVASWQEAAATSDAAALARLAEDHRITGLVGDLFGHVGTLTAARVEEAPSAVPPRLRLHDDAPAVTPDRLLAVLVALDAHAPDDGAIELLPARHRPRRPDPYAPPLDFRAPSFDLAGAQLVAPAAGDFLCLHSLTPHRRRPGRGAPRRLLHFTFAVEPAGLMPHHHRAR